MSSSSFGRATGKGRRRLFSYFPCTYLSFSLCPQNLKKLTRPTPLSWLSIEMKKQRGQALLTVA
jgi:hypothetical protein